MMAPQRYIVGGQSVNPVKAARAKQLRRDATPEEQLLWQELRKLRPRGFIFRHQQVIDGFIADFYCHTAGLVVELDGAHHDDQAEYDAERDHIIKARKLTVLRFSNAAVQTNLNSVLKTILATAKEATSPPPHAGEGAGG